MSRPSSTLFRAALVGSLVLGLTGCFTNPDIEDVVENLRWELEPAELDEVVKLRLGGGSLGLARTICGFVPDCREEALGFLQGIDEVHLGIFEINGDRYDDPIYAFSDDLREDMADTGWDVVMTVQESHGESVWVMAQVDRDELLGLYVVSVDRDELVVVRLEGELNETLDAALRRDEDFMVSLGDIGDEW